MWWIILAFLLLRKKAPQPSSGLLPPAPLPQTQAPESVPVFAGSIYGIVPIVDVTDGAQKLMQPGPSLGFPGRYNY